MIGTILKTLKIRIVRSQEEIVMESASLPNAILPGSSLSPMRFSVKRLMMGLAGDILQMNIGQICQTPRPPSFDFTDQTIIITGANTGLASKLPKTSHLILACRSLDKGEKARKQVLASSRKLSPGNVEVWELEMSKYSSVLAFGNRMQGLTRLDAFVANAGIDTGVFERFEGHESTITVNVISTILVAMLAIPVLRHSSKLLQKPSRLVLTGSVVHIFGNHNHLSEPKEGEIFFSLDNESTADMSGRYVLSKLILLLAARKLAEELSHTSEKAQGSVILNYVNPGWCKTELFRVHDGGLGARIGLRLIGRTADEGSRTLVHAAIADADTHGKYLSECRIKLESTWVRSSEAAQTEKLLWTELVDILENIRPGVTHL